MFYPYLPAGVCPVNSFESFLKSYDKAQPVYITHFTGHIQQELHYSEPQFVMFGEGTENGWLLQNDTIVVNNANQSKHLRLVLVNSTSKYFRIYKHGVYYFYFISQELVDVILDNNPNLLDKYGIGKDKLIGIFFYSYSSGNVLDIFMISSERTKSNISGGFSWNDEYFPNPKIKKRLGRRYILELLALYGLKDTELNSTDIFSEEGYSKFLDYYNTHEVNDATQELYATLVNNVNYKYATDEDILNYKVKPYIYAFACQSYTYGISAMGIAIADSDEDKLYESALVLLMNNPNIMTILTDEEKYLYALGLFNINYHNNNSNSAPINCLWVYILLYELYTQGNIDKYPELIEMLAGILCFNGDRFAEFINSIKKEKFPIKGWWRTTYMSWEDKSLEYVLFSIIYHLAGDNPKYELLIEEHDTNKYCIGNLIRSNFRSLYKGQVLDKLQNNPDFYNKHESVLREFYTSKLYESIKDYICHHGWYCNRKNF